MKIRNYFWLVLIIGLISIPSAAQRRREQTATGSRIANTSRSAAQELSAAERTAALDTSLSTTCAETAPLAPKVLAHDANVFAPQRIANTLNGVWVGKVSGEYDKQLFADDGFLNVDYYMIVDISRGEAFTYQEFGDKRSAANFAPKAGAPKWTYVWCARENYQTKSPRQIHEFTKVSDNVQDARSIIANSVGVTFSGGEPLILSNVWRKLVDSKFFDDPNRSLAYAGVLFNPLTMGTVQSAGGGTLFELRMVGEYRGSGQTAAQFVPGVPIHNVEQAHFLGVSGASISTASSPRRGPRGTITTAETGDYLTASYALGNEMEGPKDDAVVAVFSTQMAFDKVVIGPLGTSPSFPTATSPKTGRARAEAAPAKTPTPNTGRTGRGQR
ncbi:MAG TPA: hypothetical protein VFR78_10030 [Pyrinomonadaceae bacterium]|nr:hypothetical protein [Pyrinomonadaceae bacterium]